MFWEYYQQSQIHDAKGKAARAESKVQAAGVTLRRMEDKVEAMALTCQALWEILREQSNITDDQLVAKITEIDLRDGKADGKMGSRGTPCEKCGRMLSNRRNRCMYCGEFVGKDHVFQQ